MKAAKDELAVLNEQIASASATLEKKINDRFDYLSTLADLRKGTPSCQGPHDYQHHRRNMLSMNRYLKDYATEAFYLTAQQILQAKREVVHAYEVINKIIENPNLPIEEQKLAILQIRNTSLRRFVVSLVVCCASILILCLMPLYIHLLTTAATVLTFSFCMAALLQGSMIMTTLSGIQLVDDSSFCDTLLNTTPTFFGKVTAPVAPPVADTSTALEQDLASENIPLLESPTTAH